MSLIRAGDIAEYRDRLCEVVSYEDDKITLLPLMADVGEPEPISFSTEECRLFQKDGSFTLTKENAYLGVCAKTCFALMAEREREEAMARRDLMLRLEDASKNGKIPNAKVKAIAHVWAEEQGRKTPNHSTVRRWQGRWTASGHDIFSLVPDYLGRGRRGSHLEREVDAIIDEVIETFYLTIDRLTETKVFLLLVDAIRVANEGRVGDNRLKCPSKRAFKARIAELDPFQVDVMRLGRQEAERIHKASKRFTRTALYPNHIWQVDATPLDIYAVDPETGESKGRVYLTVIIDQFSRCVVGYFLSYEPNNYCSIARALMMGILDKEELLERFPTVRGVWLCHGKPTILIADNAMENHSKAFSEMCVGLEIELIYTARRHPQGKPHVERLIGTINKYFHGLPGTTFSNRVECKGYKSKKMACLLLHDVEEELLRFIVDIHHVRKHRSLGRAPEEVWEEGVEEYRPIMPRSNLDLKLVYMAEKQHVLHKDGIHFKNRIYQGPITEQLWSDKGRISVKFRHDVDNRGSILVIHPDTGDVAEARCIDMPEYAEGRSEREDKEIQRIARTYSGDLTREQRVARAETDSRKHVETCRVENRRRKRATAKKKKETQKERQKVSKNQQEPRDPNNATTIPDANWQPPIVEYPTRPPHTDTNLGGGSNLMSIMQR